ncbi:MAG TPA: hypothetical protein PKE12_02085 [Kiritimatiellia bacterium]|nr:hypothetical protein [Kiritimatiellia bacterium]
MVMKIRRIPLAAGLLTAALLASAVAPGAFAQPAASKSPTPATAAAPKGMDDVEARVKAMQDSIKNAFTQFQRANSSPDEKMVRLDKLLVAIDSSLAELREGGPLHKEIGKAITHSEAIQSKYKNKTTDPNIEAKIRERYQKLADKIALEINQLYQRRMVLNQAISELDKQRAGLTQERDFIVDLITIDEITEANAALLEVVDSVKAVVDSINRFAENIVATPAPEATGKETR